MRSADYLRLAARDLRRQPVRSALTLLSLTVSAAVLVTLGGLSSGAQQAIVTAMSPDSSLTTILVTSNKSGTSSLFGTVRTAGQNTVLTDDNVTKLKVIPNVEFASPRAYIWEFNTVSINGSRDFIAQTEAVKSETTQTMPLLAGRHVAAGDSHEVVIGAAYARELGQDPAALVGKTATITTQKGYRGPGAVIPQPNASLADREAFTKQTTQIEVPIVGVTADGSNQNRIFVPLEWGKQIRTAQYWEAPGKLKKVDQFADSGYTSVVVKVTNTEAVPTVSKAIEELGYGQLSTLEVVQKLMSITKIMWVVLGAVALVSLLAASLGIVNTMLMVVSEQRFVIGVWRACGARRSQIAGQFLLQAALLGVVGGILGAAVGLAVNQFVATLAAEVVASQGLATIQIPVAPWWMLTGTVVLTIIFAVLAGMYPAVKAARQDPSTALATA